jgi:DNA-binding NarL/FixJ family response regulator
VPASPARVLICDDSLGFPTLLQAWLREDGRFTVVGRAKNGAEGRAMVEQERPDAIVLDLLLPDEPDTPALVRDLREAHPPLRVLLISSLHLDGLAAAAEASGADGFCGKAAQADEFAERLQAVLDAPGG